MARMVCPTCHVIYPVSETFCARCGQELTRLQERKPSLSTPAVIAIVVGAFVVLTALISVIINDDKPLDGSQREANTLSKSSINTAQAVENFRNKVMALPGSDKIISAIQAGEVEGVLRLQVTNVWFDLRPHEKRQLTQMIANLWQTEIGDRLAIVHIYDFTGREIAGTRAFGGVWVENE